MKIPAIIDALLPALRGMFGPTWTVDVADDEWSLLQLLCTNPSGVRAVILCDEHRPYGEAPRGLAGPLSGRAVVQMKRTLDKDSAVPLKALLEAEEKMRRALLAICFQMPGDPDWPQDFADTTMPPHPEVGQFSLTGSGIYRPPQSDLMLEHPAREVRWSLPVAFRIPAQVRRIDIPLAAGN